VDECLAPFSPFSSCFSLSFVPPFLICICPPSCRSAADSDYNLSRPPQVPSLVASLFFLSATRLPEAWFPPSVGVLPTPTTFSSPTWTSFWPPSPSPLVTSLSSSLPLPPNSYFRFPVKSAADSDYVLFTDVDEFLAPFSPFSSCFLSFLCPPLPNLYLSPLLFRSAADSDYVLFTDLLKFLAPLTLSSLFTLSLPLWPCLPICIFLFL
jgi:hypothetical protein